MEQSSHTKSKVIIAVVVLAAIALIYLASMGKPHVTSANAGVNDTPLSSSSQQSTPASPSGSSSSGSTVKAGTYTATGSYRTPADMESITVTLAIAGDGTVTDSSIQQTAANRESEQYQAAFKSGYKQYVVGKKLSDINVGFVSGSSLTAGGFEEALTQIESQAQQG